MSITTEFAAESGIEHDVTCLGCGAFRHEPCRTGCPTAASASTEQLAGRMADEIIEMLAPLPRPARKIRLETGSGVLVTHPSGRDWIVASIVEAPSGLIVQIAEYADRCDGLWVDVLDAFTAVTASRTIFQIVANHEANRG